MNHTIKPLLTIVLSGMVSGSTTAATIAGVTIEDVSSELTAPFNRLATYTLDGTGYSAGVPSTHSNATDGVAWLSKGVFQAPNDPLPAVITYDLGVNYDLSSMTVWNYNEVNLTSRGANNVEILVASSVGGPFTSLGNVNFVIAPGTNNTPYGQDIPLTAAAADDTRLIRFNILSNHGDNNQFAGLAEVRFDGVVPVAAIPEPTTTALLGLGGLALVFRRRK